MSTKFFKIISVGVLALALAVFTGGIANAVVTLNATTVSSDVALTLTGAATSVWSLSGAGAALTINSGGAAALTLDSGTTGAVNLATGASAKTITIGNNATTTSLALTSGTGSQTFTSSVATTGTASSAFVFSAGALTSGTGLYLSTTADTGTAQSIVANSLTTGTGLSVTSSGTMLTTGALLSLVADSATTAGVSAGDGLMRLSADGLTTGTGLDVTSTSAVLGAGELANFEHIASNVLLTAKTGQLVDITSSRTSTRLSGTTADDYDVASIIRTSVQNGASGTLTATGSALYVENVATQTAGTLTDSTKGIEVVMDVDGTGDGIEVTHNALTGVALDVISAANTGSGQVITANALTTGTGLRVISSGVIATTGELVEFTASGATDSTGVVRITTAGLTTGEALLVQTNTANFVAGGTAIAVDLVAAVAGNGITVTTTGAYTGTGLLKLFADTATTSGVTVGEGIMTISADALTTGAGLDITSTSAVLTSGELANFEHIASSATLVAKTGQLVDITSSRDYTAASGTVADDYDALSVTRTNINTTAGGTLTATGSALRVENVATQTAGTLTDSTKGIEVVMDVDGTGDGIEVTHNALTGVALDVISAANTGSGQVITANALTTGTGLRVISSGVIATTGELVEFTASGATDSTGVVRITTAGLTTGTALLVQTSTANFTTGAKAIEVDLVAALAGNGITVTTTGAYTGTGLNLITANGLTTGIAQAISSTSNVLTSGKLLSATWAPLLVTAISAGNLAQIVDSPTINATVAATHNDLNITRTNATTATVITYTPSGSLVKIVNASPTVGGGSTITDSAVVLDVQQNNATGTGNAFKVTDVKGAGTANIAVNIVANSLTTSTGALTVSANALISGTTLQLNGVEVTMTTGRYLSAYDGATEVFGIGANGHIHSTVSADPPTIAVTTQNGITAAAITSGGTDTAGIITTTGTNNNGGVSVLQVTFGKTYTTAPKTVLLFPRNSAASKAATTSYLGVFVSATSATTFDITIPADAAAAATPSWNYFVIQ